MAPFKRLIDVERQWVILLEILLWGHLIGGQPDAQYDMYDLFGIRTQITRRGRRLAYPQIIY